MSLDEPEDQDDKIQQTQRSFNVHVLLCRTLAQKFSEESVQVIKAFNVFLNPTLAILQTQYLVQLNVFPLLKKCFDI